MKNKDLRSSSSEGKVSSQCVVTNRNEEEETNSRMLEVNRDGMWMNRDKKFPWNGIKTTRYNILTFVPVNLFEQFRRLANFYFFIGVLLQLDESISPFPTWSVVTPFVFILSVTAIKEAYEDIKRWKEDRKLNQKMYKRVMKDGELRPVRSQNIRVGDILFVSKGEVFPADVILIGTSNHDNSCYINTAELDGETAPKSKRSADLGIEPTATSVSQIKAKIVASSPTAKFDGFEGRLEVDRSALASKDENSKGVVPLGDQQLCLRGSKVDNTEFVLCVVYATGKDTKLMLNRHANSFKFSSFEKKLNHGVFLQLLIQLIVNLLFASVNTLSKVKTLIFEICFCIEVKFFGLDF